MDILDIEDGLLRSAAIRVVDASQEIEGMRQRVNTLTEQLLAAGGGWTGPAANTYRRAMAGWSEKAATVRRDLEVIADNMHLNAATYGDANDDIGAGMNKVDALINGSAK
jgi:WXG100 family type VII secretion target